MNLDDELRRLFADDRLELSAAPGADHTILSGARRLRRRRAAMTIGAAVLVVVAVAGGAAVATTDRRESRPPAETPTTTPIPAAKTLGPFGYGNVRLGMSLEEALASGEIVPPRTQTEGNCMSFLLRDNPHNHEIHLYANVGVEIVRDGARTTVESVGAWPGVLTPEGIGIGSTPEQVRAAYPDAAAQLDAAERTGMYIVWVEVPGGPPQARYQIDFDDHDDKKVKYLTLIGMTMAELNELCPIGTPHQ